MKNNKRFCVYAHLTKDTNRLFYIGEGVTNDRPYTKRNRNKYWNNIVNKHGFIVRIIRENLTKDQAEKLEKRIIIICKKLKIKISNFCIGPMIENHWLINAPKEIHPMYGKKNPKASERIRKRNLGKFGKLSNTYGLKRPDLVNRNKNGVFKRYTKKIKCLELNIEFESIKLAKDYMRKNYNYKRLNIDRALKNGTIAGGFHWQRLN